MVANVFDLSHTINKNSGCADILVLKINYQVVKRQFICIAGDQEEESIQLAHADWIDVGMTEPLTIENIVTTLKKLSNGSGMLKCYFNHSQVKITWE